MGQCTAAVLLHGAQGQHQEVSRVGKGIACGLEPRMAHLAKPKQGHICE